jgi:hypothetical protein
MEVNAFVYRSKYQAHLAERENQDSSEIQVYREQSVHPLLLHPPMEFDNIDTFEAQKQSPSVKW